MQDKITGLKHEGQEGEGRLYLFYHIIFDKITRINGIIQAIKLFAIGRFDE